MRFTPAMCFTPAAKAARITTTHVKSWFDDTVEDDEIEAVGQLGTKMLLNINQDRINRRNGYQNYKSFHEDRASNYAISEINDRLLALPYRPLYEHETENMASLHL